MIIKKLVVGSMFSMLLVSEMAVAAWGDVYYCQMTNSFGITAKGERKSYTLEKFQFKLDQTKNAMVFGNKGYFKYKVIELDKGMNFPSQESWYTQGLFSSTHFEKGKFLFTENGHKGLSAASADCDKF